METGTQTKASNQTRPKDDLHRFIGMLNYLSPYIPKFADKAHNLKGLLKSDSQWTWDTDYQKFFEDLKTTVTVDTFLKYYNPTATLTLEVDASQSGIGVALVQDNTSIAFGSRTLTDYQSRYSNIEREILADCVWYVARSYILIRKIIRCSNRPQTSCHHMHKASACCSPQDTTTASWEVK